MNDTDSDRILKLRALAHDLSNSLETITQAGYLLAQARLEDDSRKWVGMINTAVRDCARLNVEIREILRAHGARLAETQLPPAPRPRVSKKAGPSARVSKNRSSSRKNRRRDT